MTGSHGAPKRGRGVEVRSGVRAAAAVEVDGAADIGDSEGRGEAKNKETGPVMKSQTALLTSR